MYPTYVVSWEWSDPEKQGCYINLVTMTQGQKLAVLDYLEALQEAGIIRNFWIALPEEEATPFEGFEKVLRKVPSWFGQKRMIPRYGG